MGLVHNGPIRGILFNWQFVAKKAEFHGLRSQNGKDSGVIGAIASNGTKTCFLDRNSSEYAPRTKIIWKTLDEARTT
jgi:hypothetical protein